MKELTKAEEQVMQILWEMKKGFVKEIVEHFPEPKPAYNTVSTIVRILEKKGFVSHESFGKSHRYFPNIDKSKYTKSYMQNFIGNYFGNSFSQMVSFFANDKNMSITELEESLKIIEEKIDKREDEK